MFLSRPVFNGYVRVCNCAIKIITFFFFAQHDRTDDAIITGEHFNDPIYKPQKIRFIAVSKRSRPSKSVRTPFYHCVFFLMAENVP